MSFRRAKRLKSSSTPVRVPLLRGKERDMALAVVEEFARTPDEHVEAILAIDEFRVDVERDRGGVRLSPVGEVDASTIEHLRESFYEATATGAERVVLDLRETTFLDSTGLHFAVDVDAWAKMRGIEF